MQRKHFVGNKGWPWAPWSKHTLVLKKWIDSKQSLKGTVFHTEGKIMCNGLPGRAIRATAKEGNEYVSFERERVSRQMKKQFYFCGTSLLGWMAFFVSLNSSALMSMWSPGSINKALLDIPLTSVQKGILKGLLSVRKKSWEIFV